MPEKTEKSGVDDCLARAKEIVNRSTAHAREAWERNYCIDWVMSALDEEGYPASSMITASRADGFDWISFCTSSEGNKPKRIGKDARTCVYLWDEKSFTGISLVGRTRVITDADVKKQMWYDELGDSFQGPEDPAWCVLLFKPERYHLFIDFHTIRGTFE